MPDNSDYEILLAEFPELQLSDIVIEKEALAHFGLLFSGFARLEAALHNCYIFKELPKEVVKGNIKSEDAWRNKYDELEKNAFKATFGSLINMVSDYREIEDCLEDLRELKKSRDYFAHHFFREENEKLFHNESAMFLISEMNKLRKEVQKVEKFIEIASNELFSKMYPAVNLEDKITEELERVRNTSPEHYSVSVGWSKKQ